MLWSSRMQPPHRLGRPPRENRRKNVGPVRQDFVWLRLAIPELATPGRAVLHHATLDDVIPGHEALRPRTLHYGTPPYGTEHYVMLDHAMQRFAILDLVILHLVVMDLVMSDLATLDLATLDLATLDHVTRGHATQGGATSERVSHRIDKAPQTASRLGACDGYGG